MSETIRSDTMALEQEGAEHVRGVVTNIQRFSIHDGPGIRTTVFMKGCNLRCFWCHNPETWHLKPELQVFPQKCIGCGACLEVCPNEAHVMTEEGKQFIRERCEGCGACADVCYAGALVLVGERVSVDDVLEEVLADRAFYESSGGGVTLSGGEPTLQMDFAYEILSRSREAGLHTAIETNAHCRWEDLERLLTVTDLVMTDIKHMDSEVHREAVGVSNERILENHRRLMKTDKPVIFRTPVIPTVNASDEAIDAIAAYIRELGEIRAEAGSEGGMPRLELLPFHKLASDKFRSLDLDYQAEDLTAPDKEAMAAWVEVARAHGIDVEAR
jgi:pyruvate formate lyase activating enzyme